MAAVEVVMGNVHAADGRLHDGKPGAEIQGLDRRYGARVGGVCQLGVTLLDVDVGGFGIGDFLCLNEGGGGEEQCCEEQRG